LGVCAAIGTDFGFSPEILRVALAAGVLWNPLAMLAIYGVAALLMFAGRALFPVAKTEPKALPAASFNEAPHMPAVEERLAA
jgi:phage shock protein PspC (stress-responsive transcriptional regulator)